MKRWRCRRGPETALLDLQIESAHNRAPFLFVAVDFAQALIAGQLLAIGQSPSMLVAASIPLIVVAAIAALLVVARFPRGYTAAITPQT